MLSICCLKSLSTRATKGGVSGSAGSKYTWSPVGKGANESGERGGGGGEGGGGDFVEGLKKATYQAAPKTPRYPCDKPHNILYPRLGQLEAEPSKKKAKLSKVLQVLQ